MNEVIIPWPPLYQVKRHRRARRVKLRAEKKSGIVITIPWRFSVKHIPSILEENKSWILKQLEKTKPIVTELPKEIIIPILNKLWKIHYVPSMMKPEIIERPSLELVLLGESDQLEFWRKRLMRWIKNQSLTILTNQLNWVSQMLQLPYAKLMIRNQKSVWGSCNSQHLISLNYKLIFLPVELMNYVIIHELCHTKHLNHSQRFWKLVAKWDPQWEIHRKQLRSADQYIPDWL